MPSAKQSDSTGESVREIPLSSGEGQGPSLRLVARVWLSIGLQSFGGGTATLYLIQRAVVDRYGWLSEEEFVRDWAICQPTPGINLICLTILIGRRLAGVAGIMVSLLGLLLPSVLATVLLTAIYASVRDLSVVREAIRGIVPATVGLGLIMALQMIRPILRASSREGTISLLMSCALLVGSGLCIAIWQAPTVAVLLCAGAMGALLHLRKSVITQAPGDGAG